MKLKLGAVLAITVIVISCKKNENTTTPPQADNYLNTSSGSSWNYHVTDNSGIVPANDYTLTSTSLDTSINGKSYHVFTNSAGGSQYTTIIGHDYYQFDSLPTGISSAAIERLYLKDNLAAGDNWNQSITIPIPGSIIPIPFTVSNTISAVGISRTVNGIIYNDVIQVSTQISSLLIPAASLVTSIDSYYAKKYGLIENTSVVHLDFAGIIQDIDSQTILLSANLK